MRLDRQMYAGGGDNQMSDARRRAMTEFGQDLQRLRQLAGSPTLNQLVELTADVDPPLHRSTISDKLNAKSLAEWDFVVSFVTACQRYAERSGVPLPLDDVDLTRWDALHLRMLREVDETREDERLIRAAGAEVERRAARGRPTAPVAAAMVPRQLPAALRTFTGRTAELAALTALVDDAGAESAVVATIDGMAGIGKSSLALYWAHRNVDRFPDGQLHINLRGFGPGAPVSPSEALHGFLDALGVPPHRIPAGADERTGLYRSLLAGRRILILLDNARDSEQVRPLLPGTAGCVVLVTSRNRLAGLLATDATLPLSLTVVGADEAHELLARRLTPARLAADPGAVGTIIDRCAGLPMALGIVAARAASRPALRLADLADELARDDDGLDGFRADETPGGDMRAVFSWSYRQLDAAAARVFRAFGLHPAADMSVAAAASTAGVATGRAREILSDLAGAHLVDERRPGRFGCHDLLRAYAAELSRVDDADADRRDAVRRLLDHYLHSAYGADRRLEPGRDPITLDDPTDGVVVVSHEDAAAASAWLAEHHGVVIAAADLAAEWGFDDHAWRLAWTLTPFLDRRADWHSWAATHVVALAAARRLGYGPAIAYAHRIIGRAYIRLGRLDEAYGHMSEALRTYVELGDDKGTANSHEGLSLICEFQDRFPEALDHSQRALALLTTAGHVEVVGRLTNSVGWCLGLLGDHERALAYCRDGLAHNQGLGDRSGESESWDSLGHLYHEIGDHAEAAACLRRALDLHRELGYRFPEGETLNLLGDALDQLGDHDGARESWRSALVVFADLRDPRAGDLREKLNRPVPA
jgi:tetratricopeptide (TPR) repeat protein